MRLHLGAALGMLLWQWHAGTEPPLPRPEFMRYQRAVSVPRGQGEACAALDAAMFPHAAPSLADVRIFPVQGADTRAVPYVITMSQTAAEETQSVRVLNLGAAGGGSSVFSFDLEMPHRAYSDVALQLAPEVRDFLATATVTGREAPGSEGRATALGSFTLFDLSSQHLSRDTVLPLAESTFPYLHVVLSVSPAGLRGRGAGARFEPGLVRGAEVPPSREAQVLYTPVAETTDVPTRERETVARLEVSRRVPVERVSFVLPAEYKGNFSRRVRIVARRLAAPEGKGAAQWDSPAPAAESTPPEEVAGTILRVHTTEAGREIRREQLSIPAILGANLQQAAEVEVRVDNGDDRPLPIAAVRLEMRQRLICFDRSWAEAGGLAVFYGDAALAAPAYDYARTFVKGEKPVMATLGPEVTNAAYRERDMGAKPFTERHPEVLWIALIAVVCVLGMVALRSARSTAP